MIYRLPEIVWLPVETDKHLVKEPGIRATCCPGPDALGIFRPKARTPLSNRLVNDRYAPTPQDLFDAPETQRKAVLKPGPMTDDFARKPEAFVIINAPWPCPILPRWHQLEVSVEGATRRCGTRRLTRRPIGKRANYRSPGRIFLVLGSGANAERASRMWKIRAWPLPFTPSFYRRALTALRSGRMLRRKRLACQFFYFSSWKAAIGIEYTRAQSCQFCCLSGGGAKFSCMWIDAEKRTGCEASISHQICDFGIDWISSVANPRAEIWTC